MATIEIDEFGRFRLPMNHPAFIVEGCDFGPSPVFASQPRTCEDCKGKGKIELFVSIETCRKCGGKGTV
jgi:hypothetical protein